MTSLEPADARPVLQMSDLRVAYGGREVLALDDFLVAPGEVVAVIGPNGSGKSTLLRAAALLLAPSSGRVALFGRQPRGSRERTALRRRTGSVFANAALLDMSVRRNIETALRLHGVAADERRERSDYWLARFGILDRADDRPYTLSAGEAQRASLARALAVEPDLLLLDEPFSALDLESRSRLVGEIRELLLGGEIAAVLATHDRTEARLLADRVTLLLDGRPEQEGPTEQVFTQPQTTAAAAFLGYSVIPSVALDDAPADSSFGCVPPDGAMLATDAGGDSRSVSVLSVQGATGHAQVVVDIGARLTLQVPVEDVVASGLRVGETVDVRIDRDRIVWL
jgi:tungstate transport system ATP-binding protein